MSKRILRINELIKREINQIILREIEFPANTLVTITRVETNANLAETRVYISCLPETQISKALQILKMNIYHIQQLLNQGLSIRIVPRIRFVEEIKTKEAGRIEEILVEIKKGKSV